MTVVVIPQDDIEFWLSDMPPSAPSAADSAAPAASNAELLAPSAAAPAPAPVPAEAAPTANGEATPPETNGDAKQKKHKSGKKSKKSKKVSGGWIGVILLGGLGIELRNYVYMSLFHYVWPCLSLSVIVG